MTREGDWTPWGPAQYVGPLRDGVDAIATARHGGLRLSLAVAATLPAGFTSTTGKRDWIEEDVDMPMILWFLRLGHDADLFALCEHAAKTLGGRSARNWKALKAGRQARMRKARDAQVARIRAARARALAEVAG